MTTVKIDPKHHMIYDGAVLNIYHANKGEGLPKHNHEYAHATLCSAGSCYVRNSKVEILMTKDTQPINLVAVDWHEIEALEDGTVFINVFAEGKN